MIINMFFCCSISICFSFLGGGVVRFLFIKFKKYFSSLGYYYEIPSIGAIRLNTQVNTHSVTLMQYFCTVFHVKVPPHLLNHLCAVPSCGRMPHVQVQK